MRDQLTRIGKRFLGDVQRDDAAGLAAELAYRFLFAIFPFGIFVAALTAFVAAAIGIADPTSQIIGAVGDNLPKDIAAGIRPQLEAVIGTTRPGLLTIGAVTALWAATGGTNRMTRTPRCRRGSPPVTRSSVQSWGHRLRPLGSRGRIAGCRPWIF